MPKLSFQEVSLKAKFHWMENGKPRQLTRSFIQTISPFNINQKGEIKTMDEITAELIKQRDEWLSSMEKIFC